MLYVTTFAVTCFAGTDRKGMPHPSARGVILHNTALERCNGSISFATENCSPVVPPRLPSRIDLLKDVFKSLLKAVAGFLDAAVKEMKVNFLFCTVWPFGQ